MTATIPAASVGRIVHFKGRREADEIADRPCLAAIVTKVHSAWNVDLTIFALDGSTFSKTSVTNVDGEPNGTGWHWPERVE